MKSQKEMLPKLLEQATTSEQRENILNSFFAQIEVQKQSIASKATEVMSKKDSTSPTKKSKKSPMKSPMKSPQKKSRVVNDENCSPDK